MPNETDDGRRAPRTVSRRNLFKQVAGAAAAFSATTPAVVSAAAEPPTPAAREAWRVPAERARRFRAGHQLRRQSVAASATIRIAGPASASDGPRDVSAAYRRSAQVEG